MDIGLSRNKVRLSLLATLVAASSALVAAPVQAGKAPPAFEEEHSIDCVAVEALNGPGGARVIAAFDVVEGKGKWVFVDTTLVVDGQPNPDWSGHRVDRSEQIVVDTSLGPAKAVAVVATLVNRKGEPFDTVETEVVDCTAG